MSWEVKRRLIEVLVAGIRVDTVEEFGVRQTKTTVAYRFSPPGELMPLVLPQEYGAGRMVRIPVEPQTIGDHIRRRRLELKLKQSDVAARLGATESCVFNWEANTSQPQTRFMPAVILFLGYNPMPEVKTIAERLVRRRTTLGMSQKEAAKALGVDPATLAKWERGEREPTGAFTDKMRRFLTAHDGRRSAMRRAG